MFDTLSDKLQATLSDLRGQGKLSEEDLSRAMREIRLALLEADVNFQVVKDFVARVKERAAGDHGAGELEARVCGPPANGHPHGRPPGLGEDDGLREARTTPAQGGEG